MGLFDRLKNGWNAFIGRDPTVDSQDGNYGVGYGYRPDRPRFRFGNERTIAASVFNRIAIDASTIRIEHVQLDTDDRFLSVRTSKLNNCLTLDANTDQTGRAFIQDVVMSMFDEGVVAICPIDTTDIPTKDGGGFDIVTLRTGEILNWYPQHVRVRAYNERSGQKEEVVFPKRTVAIVENPFYAVVNEPNSTLKRLIHKLALLDATDENTASGKLDMIIQLPYIIKTPARKKQAEERRELIEKQLAGSKYGIAYTDGTERITQLNRSVDNQLMDQIKYLMEEFYSHLGITADVLNGTANEETMLNYYSRTIEPILAAIVDEMKRKFLTPTARTQGQSIIFVRDPFKLVPISQMADLAGKLIPNQVVTSNEIRQWLGLRPSNDPIADQLRNPNINTADSYYAEGETGGEMDAEGGVPPDEEPTQ